MEKDYKMSEPKAITPFDAESIENIKDMTYKKTGKREIKIISDEIGKRGFIE